ncbi:hypothetical protein HGB13_02720 [bacterium]|nr:hypothetical protein [bacterium]
MKEQTAPRFIERILEIIPGALVWMALAAPIVLSFSYPTHVAYFIIAFDIFWFFKAFYMSKNLIHAYSFMMIDQKTDWNKKLNELNDINSVKEELKKFIEKEKRKIYTIPPFSFLLRISKKWRKKISYFNYSREFLGLLSNVNQEDIINANGIYHLIILATFQEDISILRQSINAVKESNFDNKKVLFVLAGEERDKERFIEYRDQLSKEYEDTFGFFMSTIHPMNIEGEVKGKGGNITFAGREALKRVNEMGLNYSNVIVTTLDADNIVHPQYLPVLTYKYAINKSRVYRSFQPVPIFNNNIWDVPAPVRIVGMSNGFWQLIESTRPERLRNFSSHAQSLAALVDTNFWSTTTIVEDGHQYWRTFFRYDGDHEVVPLFMPIYQDAVQEDTFLKTMKAQYVQLRRWAWGASDFPYVTINTFKNNKIPLYKKIIAMYRMMEGYFFWATAPMFITIAGWLPGLINTGFKYTVVAFNLPQITSLLMTIATVGIFVNILVSILLLPPRPKKYNIGRHIMMGVQWVLLPFVTLFLSAIPAIDAQTRLMIGKRLDWKVTKKKKR